MVCLVNVVEIIVSVMMIGIKVVVWLWLNEFIGSKVSLVSRVIGMNMVNSSCLLLCNSSFNFRLNCVVSIRGMVLGWGFGLKVFVGKVG